MKVEEIIYDIKHLLNALTDDTRVSDAHLLFKINNYRDFFLREELRFDKTLNNSYYQKLPEINVFHTNSGDLPDVNSTIKFGKITLPDMMIPEDREEPFLNLYMTARHRRIYYITRDVLMEMIFAMDSRLDYTNYYLYEGGNNAYIYPYHKTVSGNAVLTNPLDAKQFYTTDVHLSDLENGVEYIVTSGYIKEMPSATLYKIGGTFTANLNYTYSGDGKVYRTSKVIENTMQGEYPVTGSMAEKIVLEIITKDFQIEKRNVMDIFNDAVDQLKVVNKGE